LRPLQDEYRGSGLRAEGVQHVEVDLATKQLTVAHDAEEISVGGLVYLLKDQGYDVESFEEMSA
jgi:hypothetical protein